MNKAKRGEAYGPAIRRSGNATRHAARALQEEEQRVCAFNSANRPAAYGTPGARAHIRVQLHSDVRRPDRLSGLQDRTQLYR
ncbi:hypothetical protein D3C81_1773340 [compost metagenome]